MPTSVCMCNNRGGVGKTFMTFQTSAAVAVENPDKKVLALDFSIYSDLSALMLGGTAAKDPLEPSVGLSTAKQKIPSEKRVEGLLAAIHDDEEPGGRKPRGLFAGVKSVLFNSSSRVSADLMNFAVRVADYNTEMPPNLYLVASAGRDSYDEKTKAYTRALDDREEGAAKKRREAGQALRRAVDALPSDFCAVIFDTDHLAGSALTRLALAAAETCAVPSPTDTAEFHRLFQTPDSEQFGGVESLFGDVMISMSREGTLRAKVRAMIFTKVPSYKNDAHVSAAGIRCAFTPTAVMSKQMDVLARVAWKIMGAHPEYKELFLEENISSNEREFIESTFRTFKLVPDLARNISTSNGVPIAVMTSGQYTTASGITGSTGNAVLEALRKEISTLV